MEHYNFIATMRLLAMGILRRCGLRTGQRVFCGPSVQTRSAKYPPDWWMHCVTLLLYVSMMISMMCVF